MDDYRTLIRNTIDLLLEDKRNFIDLDPSLFSALKPKLTSTKIAAPIVNVNVPVPASPPSSPPPKEAYIPPEPAPIKVSPPLPDKKTPTPAIALDDIYKQCKRLFPDLLLVSPPSDAEAKKIAQSYQYKNKAEKITILIFNDHPKERKFLENLSQALSLLLPTRVIQGDELEKKDGWEPFLAGGVQLLIACDYEIWGKKNLMKHYKEYPAKLENYLGNIPLFMLPNLSLYFKEPLVKPSLWKALCQKLDRLSLLP